MISKLLQKKSDGANVQGGLNDIFSRPIKALNFEPEPEEVPEEIVEEEVQEEDEELSALQLQERNEKTVFVGNVDMDLNKKHLLKHFKPYGKIEKIWFRSIPVEEGKLSIKASVILKKYNKEASGKNAYILFSNKEEAAKALQLNGTVIKTNHLRVDTAVPKSFDTNTTIFIGNLPFTAVEEELRTFFSPCGAIENIRIIRDHITHVGKGIAYVTFKDLLAFKAGLKMNGATFKDRGLRIKKAAPIARVEKKILKKQTVFRNNAERRIEKRRLREEGAGNFNQNNTQTYPTRHQNLNDSTQENTFSGAEKRDSNILNKKIRKVQRNTEEEGVAFKGSKGANGRLNIGNSNGVVGGEAKKINIKRKALANKKQADKPRVLKGKN